MDWHLTRLDQQFNMFAPTPLTEDGWYVFPGKLRDGTEVDVYTEKTPISYDKPKYVSEMYPNQRWQKYLMNLWDAKLSDFRLGYGRYLCREWNAKHEYNKQLMTFQMDFMLEKTPPPGENSEPVVKTQIWDHKCF